MYSIRKRRAISSFFYRFLHSYSFHLLFAFAVHGLLAVVLVVCFVNVLVNDDGAHTFAI